MIQAAKAILSRDGFLQFNMAAIAKESGLTRQTVHNLFGAKVDVIEHYSTTLRTGQACKTCARSCSQPTRRGRGCGSLPLLSPVHKQDCVGGVIEPDPIFLRD